MKQNKQNKGEGDLNLKSLRGIMKILNRFWLVLSPILIKGMFLIWFVPEVINPETTGQKIMWLIISLFVIVLSWSSAYYNLVKLGERK